MLSTGTVMGVVALVNQTTGSFGGRNVTILSALSKRHVAGEAGTDLLDRLQALRPSVDEEELELLARVEELEPAVAALSVDLLAERNHHLLPGVRRLQEQDVIRGRHLLQLFAAVRVWHRADRNR